MTYEWGNCIFTLQIFIAELLFLYSAPKRRFFLLRIIPGIAVITLLSGFYPSRPYDYSNQIYPFVKYIVLFAITAVWQGFCFKIKAVPLISACTSGYAVQHLSYQVMQLVALTHLLDGLELEVLWREHILECIVFPVTYFLVWLTFGRIAKKYEFYKNYDVRLIAVSVFALFVCLIISRFARIGSSLGNQYVIISNSLYAISCCMLSLFISYNLHVLSITRTQNETLERIGYEERRQFEASKKNREQLNVKYHDLKHVLSLLESGSNDDVIAQYKHVLNEYDSEIRTGNETLDIIINEKVEACRAENISLTFMGDGARLSFVGQYDLYSLFGNILDNAIEAVSKIEDRAKRIISVTMESQGNCVTVSAMNYFVGELHMTDGLPATTKTVNMESHGFGIRSIKLIAEKYGGRIDIDVKGEIFELSVLLIMPEQPDGIDKAEPAEFS